MNIKETALLLTVGLVVGCASTPPYPSPKSGPTAKLRVITAQGVTARVWAATKPGCVRKNGHFVEMLAATMADPASGTREGMPLAAGMPADDFAEVVVPANHELWLEFEGVRTTGIMFDYDWCTNVVSFKPNAGELYEAIFNFHHPTCHSEVLRISLNDSRDYVRVSDVSYENAEGQCR